MHSPIDAYACRSSMYVNLVHSLTPTDTRAIADLSTLIDPMRTMSYMPLSILSHLSIPMLFNMSILCACQCRLTKLRPIADPFTSTNLEYVPMLLSQYTSCCRSSSMPRSFVRANVALPSSRRILHQPFRRERKGGSVNLRLLGPLYSIPIHWLTRFVAMLPPSRLLAVYSANLV